MVKKHKQPRSLTTQRVKQTGDWVKCMQTFTEWCYRPCCRQWCLACVCLGWGVQTSASCLSPAGTNPEVWKYEIRIKTKCWCCYGDMTFILHGWCNKARVRYSPTLTCCSRTAASRTDSVSSPPATREQPAAAEENLSRTPAVEPEAFRSSSAALPLPSAHKYQHEPKTPPATRAQVSDYRSLMWGEPTSFWAKMSSIFSSRVLLKVSVFRDVRRSSMAKYTCVTLGGGGYLQVTVNMLLHPYLMHWDLVPVFK